MRKQPIFILLATPLFLAGLTSAAQAGSIAVDIDAGGAGVIAIDDSDGLCSIREAIINANDDTATHDDCAAGDGTDSLALPENAAFTVPDPFVDNTYEGHTGLPEISSEIEILGNGATVQRDESLDCTALGNPATSEFRLLWVTTAGTLTLENLTLAHGCADGNSPHVGGGAVHNRGLLTLRRVTVRDNHAMDHGGGIFNANFGSISELELLIEASTLTNNSAQEGGALMSYEDATLRNTTVSGNVADKGGGTYHLGSYLTLEHVTFSDNLANDGNGDGIYSEWGGTTFAKNVIMHDSGCWTPHEQNDWNAEGANLDSGSYCANYFETNFTANASTNLGALADNGGATSTHALLTGSEALDAAPDCTDHDNNAIASDQRGLIRPQGAACDIGAFEVHQIPDSPATIHVDAVDGDGVVEIDEGDGLCSLSEAIQNANTPFDDLVFPDCEPGYPDGADTIVLDANALFTISKPVIESSVDGNIGLPYVTSEINLEGNGATIQRDPGLTCQLNGTRTNEEFRLLQIEAGSQVTATDVTLAHGCGDGSGISSVGGVVYNRGDLTIRHTAVVDSQTISIGGGIYSEDGAQLHIEATTLAGNAANRGGALWTDGPATLRNSTVSGNSAATEGGGIYIADIELTLEHVTFSNNEINGIFSDNGLTKAKNVILDGSGCADFGSGTWTAEGNSLDSGSSCATLFGSNFISTADINLGPLADYGGQTQTHNLLTGSEALDAATSCTGFDGAEDIEIDQRGVARPQPEGFSCDIGAFERLPESAIAFTKTIISGDGYVSPGILIAYELIAENAGNTTLVNVSLSDSLLDSLECTWPDDAGELSPGQSATCTEDYIVTQEDLDNGQVINEAEVSAEDGYGTAVEATATATANASQLPALVFEKVVVSGNPYAEPGDEIAYELTATNNGNVTLDNVSITDPDTAIDNCAPGAGSALGPGESMICDAAHTITQADVDAGSFTNTALATGDDPNDNPIQDAAEATATATQSPALALAKIVTGGNPYSGQGDTITYTLTATNSGNVTVGDVVIDDPDASVSECSPAMLAPGETLSCDATHTVSQADMDTGSFTNTAMASAEDPGGNPIQDTAMATASADQMAVIGLSKDVTGGDPFAAAGDAVDYELTATNNGNVTLDNVNISDPDATIATCTPAQGTSLSPAATLVCEATHTVTQTDLDTGSFTNSAEASGDDPEDHSIQDTAETTATAAQSPAVSLIKTATSGDPYAAEGDVITYELTATNSGNVTLSNVSISDPDAAIATCTPAQGSSLPPAATITCDASYAVTQADVDAGSFTNTAEVSGDDPNEVPIQDTAMTTTHAQATSGLTVNKSASVSIFTEVGEIIEYTITVTNSGGATQTGITIADPLLGDIDCVWPDGAGELTLDASVECKGTYAVTQTDIDNGEIVNEATAESDQTDALSDTVAVTTARVFRDRFQSGGP